MSSSSVHENREFKYLCWTHQSVRIESVHSIEFAREGHRKKRRTASRSTSRRGSMPPEDRIPLRATCRWARPFDCRGRRVQSGQLVTTAVVHQQRRQRTGFPSRRHADGRGPVRHHDGAQQRRERAAETKKRRKEEPWSVPPEDRRHAVVDTVLRSPQRAPETAPASGQSPRVGAVRHHDGAER